MGAAERIAQIRERARQQQLVILVWGPGDPGSKGSKEATRYWQKRVQIRDFLTKEFYQCKKELKHRGLPLPL